jgi:hypothetical protein
MRRGFGVILGAAGLVLAALAIPSQVALAAPAGIVVMGQMVAGGQPVAGAKVTMYAWPRQAVVVALKQGAAVPMRAVGSAVSSSTGRYAISVSNWKAVQASADGDVVNLEVMAFQGRSGGVFSFPRLLVETASGPALAVDNAALTLSMAPQSADLGLVRGPSGNRRGPPDFPPCGQMIKAKYLGKRWTVVGITSSKVLGTTIDFDYGKDQSSSLGVGISATGSKGSWTASGTKSVSSSGSENFPTQTGKKTTLDKTKFTYWKFVVVCIGYQANATGWDAGTDLGHEGVPKATHCVRFAPGSGFTKSTTTAWEFSAGVSLGTVLGINLSAQTGYDTTASVAYSFARRTFLCGKLADPGGSPGLMVAGLPGG